MSVTTGKDGTVLIPLTTTTLASQAAASAGAGVYQITNANLRVLDPETPVIVSASSGALDQTYGHRGINYATGSCKLLLNGLAALGVATVAFSGAAVNTTAAVAYIYSWTLDQSVGQGDITSLGDIWADQVPLAKQATVKIDRYRTDTNFDHLASAPFVYLNLTETGTQGFLVAALNSTHGWGKAKGAVDKETLSFAVVGAVSRTT